MIEEQAAPSAEELRHLENLKKTYPLMASAIQEVIATEQGGEEAFNKSLQLILHG